MKSIKSLIALTLYYSGYYHKLRNLKETRVPILMYHRFSDKREPFKINGDVFAKQIAFFKKKYTLISLGHYCELLARKRNDYPANPMVITIDDGYEDNYLYAYPVLKKYGVPATIFLTTDFVDKGIWLWPNKLEHILKSTKKKMFKLAIDENHTETYKVETFQEWHKTQLSIFNRLRNMSNDERNNFLNNLAEYLQVELSSQTTEKFRPLTWRQINEMSHNNIEFGSHTCSHPILARLGTNELTYEIGESKQIIEKKLQKEVRSFCYPNGKESDITDYVVKKVQENGYQCAVTTLAGYNKIRTSDPFLLKRFSLSSSKPSYIAKELI